MPDGTPTNHTTLRNWLLACLLLVICYFALRLPHFRDWPTFCDEATYARWAQCVLANPLHNLWTSMVDAKPPVHTWLLALARPLADDPIASARLLSIILGGIAIPFVLLLCGELARLGPISRRAGLLLGILSSALIITCPLIAHHQRFAIEEPVLIVEAMVLGWLSLKFARGVAEGNPAKNLTRQGVVLGFCWGITLLTKQNFSYLLWSLPPAAMLAWTSADVWREHMRRFLAPFAVATTVGLAMFIPVLFTDTTLDLRTRLIYKPEFFPHRGRLLSIFDNISLLMSPYADGHPQWWPYDPARPLDGGWFYVYLTPPIFVLVIAALVWMAHRRAWRPMLFLGTWCAALLGALVIVGTTISSRYLVLGTLPLLFLVAWLLADVMEHWRQRLSPGAFRIAAALAAVAVLAWPTCAVAWSAFDWRAPVLTSCDLGQYVTRQCGGTAAEEAVAWVKAQAAKGPIAVITGVGNGLPNDLVWLKLQNQPNVQVFWDNKFPPLQHAKGNPNAFLLGTDRWVVAKTSPVTISPDCTIYIVAPRLYDPVNRVTTDEVIHADALPRNAKIAAVFNNPAKHDDETLQLVVYEMPAVNNTARATDNAERVAAMSR